MVIFVTENCLITDNCLINDNVTVIYIKNTEIIIKCCPEKKYKAV